MFRQRSPSACDIGIPAPFEGFPHFQDSPGVRRFVSHEPDDGLAAVLADATQAITEAALVVATGDLADIGEPGAYERMGEVPDTPPTPVYCLAGNHDRQDTLQACLPRPNVHLESAVGVGNWLMLFLDSDAHGREVIGEVVVQAGEAVVESSVFGLGSLELVGELMVVVGQFADARGQVSVAESVELLSEPATQGA
ncbi:metallophosphoesterase [Streptomyces sp. NBC_01224]|uniref:metallophosphoesterase n=1 Tax=Streptomyces sp. NBC_01224 TaxID=2903783 RepID=UPI002E11BC51|nr:metallophosphoesterase [Streptomyces sp. NBC_01224]